MSSNLDLYMFQMKPLGFLQIYSVKFRLIRGKEQRSREILSRKV